MTSMIRSETKGLYAAPYTPMRPDGSVDLDAVSALALHLKDTGASGAFVNGTTGESMSLTVGERMALAERWVSEADENFRLILHIGHQCLHDARELAAHAGRIGADGIACVSPSYYRPSNPGDLVGFCARVADAAPETAFYYYHIPCMTGVSFRVSDFLAAAEKSMPTLSGAKFSHDDLADLIECLAMNEGRYEMMFGKDEMMLPALAIGARAFVGSTFNFAAPLYLRLIEAFDGGDLAGAREEQLRSARMIEVLDRHRGAVAGKALMRIIGVDCGPSRPPQRSLSDEECASLRDDLDRLGFFEWFAPSAALARK